MMFEQTRKIQRADIVLAVETGHDGRDSSPVQLRLIKDRHSELIPGKLLYVVDGKVAIE